MGWGDAISAAGEWLGGDSVGGTLARLAIGYEISRYLNQNNNPPTTPVMGARQQVQPATSNRVPLVYGSAYLGGVVTDVQLTNSNHQLWAVITLTEQTGTLLSTSAASQLTIDKIYMANELITFAADGKTIAYTTDDTGVNNYNAAGLVSISLYNGSNGPFLPCSPGTTTPIAGTVPPAAYANMPGWDASYEMGGLIFAVVQMNYDPSKGVRAIPQLKFRVNNTLVWPGDVLYDYMTNDMYGAGLATSSIDITDLNALNTYSKETVCYSDNSPVTAGSFVNGTVYQISTVGTTSFTAIGAANNNVGTYFTATGAGSGTGIAYAAVPISAQVVQIGQLYYIASVGTTNFTLMGASANTVGTTFNATKLGIGTGTVYVDYSGPRYQINGVMQTSSTCMQNMNDLAAASGSDITYDISTGLWSVLIHRPTAQTLSFGDHNIIGQIALSSSNMDQYYNQIEVQYPYAVLKDQTNILRVTLPLADQNPNEIVTTLQQTQNYTNNSLQAVIIANQTLRQVREDQIITFNADYTTFGAQIGDVFGVTSNVFGWTNQQFRIIRLKKVEQDNGQLWIEITGQSYNADVYTIDSINYFLPLIGPGYSAPSLAAIATPTAPTITSSTISSQPSITLNGIVPAGVVTEMEYWYSTNTVDAVVSDGSMQIGQTYIILNVQDPTSNTAPISDFTTCGATSNTPGTQFIATLAGTSPGGVATYGSGTVQAEVTSTVVNAGSFVVGKEYSILSVGTTNFMAIGASANAVDVTFVATGPGTGNGTAVLTVYTLLGTTRAPNSGPFTVGTATSYKSILLLSGTYTFKVRAANAYGTSQFSPATAPFEYTYSMAPTVLPYATPIGTGAAAAAGLGLGLVAGYVATKMNWFQPGGIFGNTTPVSLPMVTGQKYVVDSVGTTDFSAVGGANTVGNVFIATGPGTGTGTVHLKTDLQTIFGVSALTANTIQQSAAADGATANVTPGISSVAVNGNLSFQASNGARINFQAGKVGAGNLYVNLSSVPGTNTVIIDLAGNVQGNGGGSSGNTTSNSSATLSGKVFPALFGNGPHPGLVDSRVGIFTHDLLAFGGGGPVDSHNLITANANLSISATGTIQNFYSFDTGTGMGLNWSGLPNYSHALDKYTYDSKLSVYYATASYTSGNLDQQSWSNWKLLGSNDGVTGLAALVTTTTPAVYANVWTNPVPTVSTITPATYVVEESMASNGGGTDAYKDGTFTTVATDAFVDYDPFKPNILQVVVTSPAVTTTTAVDTRQKVTTLSTGNTLPFTSGTNNLIIFGVSPFNLPNNTSFSGQTVFGHASDFYVNTYPSAIAFNQIANNGSRFVAIGAQKDTVYWSDDGKQWTRIEMNSSVTTDSSWNVGATGIINPFRFVGWNGTYFLLYGMGNRIAYSTDGKSWSEYNSTIPLEDLTTQICVTSAHYLAVGPLGIQTSTNGLDWLNPAIPSAFTGFIPRCCIWDGTQFVVGSTWQNGIGGAMFTSPDGTTWTAMPNVSNPALAQAVSAADNAAIASATNLHNGSVTSALP